MTPTPYIDRMLEKGTDARTFTHEVKKIERLLGEASEAFRRIARNPGDCDNETGFTSGHVSRDMLARITATLAGANPDYVAAPMQVSVTMIDPDTGEVKQGVAESEEGLRTLLDDERDVDALQTDPFDSDLDEPLPPKQCGIDDPECESCQ